MNEMLPNLGSERFQPPGTDRSALLKKNLRMVAIACLIGWPLAAVLLWTSYHLDVREKMFPLGPEVAFVIAPGDSARTVADHLAAQDIVGNGWLFRVTLKLSGKDGALKPGTFVLRKGSGISTVIEVLTDGRPREMTITLLEGWTIKDMGEYLVQKGAVTSTDAWYAVVGTPPSATSPQRDRPGTLQPKGIERKPWQTLEGFLFPDTYRIAAGATPESIAQKLFDTFTSRTAQAFIDAEASTRIGILDTVILASILEREVRSTADRKMVADIFLRRAAIGMALQADSTVNYVTGKKTASITLDDRDLDSPWNTYKYPGFPRGPISNPSLDAITAALHPTTNDFWYFLTDNEGNVHYAKTHDEHVANKNRYLR